MLLSVLMDLDPSHAWTPHLVDKLQKARQASGWWGTTVDSATCLAALAKYQSHAPHEKADFHGAIKLPGGKEVAFDHRKPAQARFEGDGGGRPDFLAGDWHALSGPDDRRPLSQARRLCRVRPPA